MEFAAMKSCSMFKPRASALSCRERPQPIILPHNQVSCSFDKLSLGADSGYGSVSSSASSTPEKPQRPVDGDLSQISSQAVDNEGSEQLTPIRSHSPELSICSCTYTRKTVKVKVFDKDVSEPVRSRFKDLNELFGKPLYDHLRKKHIVTGIISIKLKVLGTSESDAEPWIVVMCDKSISKRVKRFFNQSHIKSEYQPHDTNQTLPSFEILVCDRPPRLLAGNPHLNIYSDFQPERDDSGNLSGKILRIGETEKGQIATLGGIVMIESFKNAVRLYGMTTGHVVTQDPIDDIETMTSHSPYDSDEEVEDDDDGSSYASEDFEEVELESAYEDDDYDFSTNIAQDESPSTRYDVSWEKIGMILSTSDSVQRDGANLDWTLIKMTNSSLYHHYMSGRQFFESESVDHGLAKNESEKTVHFTGGVSGLGRGILSETMSYILLAPGTEFTRVYNLTLTDGAGLTAGDCGSWVIDSLSQKVYGHIVASDVFGEAYVISLEAAFRDMQKKLGVKSVFLPTTKDMLDWLSLHHDFSSPVVPREDPLRNATDDKKKGIFHARDKGVTLAPFVSHEKSVSRQFVLGKDAMNSHRFALSKDAMTSHRFALSKDAMTSHQFALSKDAVKKQRSNSDRSSEGFPPGITEEEPKQPFIYHSSARKTVDDPRNTDDTRIVLQDRLSTGPTQAMIRPSVFSSCGTARKIGEYFNHVSPKLANVTACINKPIPVSEPCPYCTQCFSQRLSRCTPELPKISGTPVKHLSTTDGGNLFNLPAIDESLHEIFDVDEFCEQLFMREKMPCIGNRLPMRETPSTGQDSGYGSAASSEQPSPRRWSG